jgi:signal transduction histidine kinase
MKPTGWASSCLKTLFALVILALASRAEAETLTIASVEWLRAGPQAIPPDNADWTAIRLPFRWNDGHSTDIKTAWYRIEFSPPRLTGGDIAVYLRRHYCATALFVNGEQAGQMDSLDQDDYVRWMRPHLYVVPAALLRKHGNVIHIQANCRDSDNDMSEILLGSESELRSRYNARYFWQITTSQIGTVLGISSGLLMIGLWWRRREETVYGFFGLGALLWGTRTSMNWIEVHPLSLWTPMHAVFYAGTGGFTIAIILFMLRYGGRHWPRTEKLLYTFWLLGPLAVLLFGFEARHWIDLIWLGGLIPIGAVGIALLGEAAFRLRSLPGYALFATGSLSLSFGFHDYLVHNGFVDTGLPFLLQMGVPLMLLAMAWLLAERFLGSLRQVEELNAGLEARIRDKERELADNYERLRAFAQQQAVAEERRRIMQDMHDGLGSQLLTSLSLVKTGNATRSDVANILQESIDDMRLVIDTLSPDEADLTASLGNLRYRLIPRFAASGIQLHWDATNLPENLALRPGASLQILRVVQEALGNILKHAGATRATVRASVYPDETTLQIAVSDNGKGFDRNAPTPGCGLSGMARRVKNIGAHLDISSGAEGTTVLLALNLQQVQ